MNSCKRNWLPYSFIILPGLSLYLPWHSPQWQPSHAVFNMFLLHYIRTGLSRLNIDKTQKTHESSSSRFTGGEDVSAGSRLEKKKKEEEKNCPSHSFIHSRCCDYEKQQPAISKKVSKTWNEKAEKRVHTCGNNTTSPHEKDRGSFTLSCSKRKCFVTRKKRKKKPRPRLNELRQLQLNVLNFSFWTTTGSNNNDASGSVSIMNPSLQHLPQWCCCYAASLQSWWGRKYQPGRLFACVCVCVKQQQHNN